MEARDRFGIPCFLRYHKIPFDRVAAIMIQ